MNSSIINNSFLYYFIFKCIESDVLFPTLKVMVYVPRYLSTWKKLFLKYFNLKYLNARVLFFTVKKFYVLSLST